MHPEYFSRYQFFQIFAQNVSNKAVRDIRFIDKLLMNDFVNYQETI